MISYKIPQFDELSTGEVFLSVPVVGNAVQMSVCSFSGMGRLAIGVDTARITIGRDNGVPLQAHAVSDDGMQAAIRRPILNRPTPRLDLKKGVQSGYWSVMNGPELQVREPVALGEFLTLVADFSVKQQAQEARRLAAQNLINKMLAEEHALYGSV